MLQAAGKAKQKALHLSYADVLKNKTNNLLHISPTITQKPSDLLINDSPLSTSFFNHKGVPFNIIT